MAEAYWIWYPGDFEIYHGMVQNLEREERGFRWPAFWHLSDFRKNIKFTKNVEITSEEGFIVTSNALGYVEVDSKKYPFGKEITLHGGKHIVAVYAARIEAFPSIYVKGTSFGSDQTWLVDDFVSDAVPVGMCKKYNMCKQEPSIWEYDSRIHHPIQIEERSGGTLFSFEKEIVGEVKIQYLKGFFPIQICYGESVDEAMDTDWCYYSQTIVSETDTIAKKAFRYLYLPEVNKDDINLYAEEIYVDIDIQAAFQCDDEEMNQIWDVSVHTFLLCSGIFFIDGIKRDRWIWSGDAYQSYFVNQYLMFEEEISKRTIWALRGNDPILSHINTIVDYSMYWVISIYNHYFISGDKEFLQAIFPKLMGMMKYLENQLDVNGFLVGKEGDWTFIDWADIDKEGAVCAEQILLAKCYHVAAKMHEALEQRESAALYEEKYYLLVHNINEFYWDQEKQAYIDSFSSGKRQISRQSNIFAILFGIADKGQVNEIYKNVIENNEIPQITTPYFKFYELEVLCMLGKKVLVKQKIKDYWGGMLKMGASTFWEQYDPRQSGHEHYEMYQDPYGKSLCHAWAASPIYLIGRYFMGIQPLDVAYERYIVEPDISLFEVLHGVFPLKEGKIEISWKLGVLKVKADRAGGTLKYNGMMYVLKEGQEVIVSVNE